MNEKKQLCRSRTLRTRFWRKGEGNRVVKVRVVLQKGFTATYLDHSTVSSQNTNKCSFFVATKKRACARLVINTPLRHVYFANVILKGLALT